MDIAGDYLFDAPQNLVWEALLDPNVLGSIMPGGEGIEEVSENTFKGMLNIKVGPVQGKFQGDIHLSEVHAPESYHIQIDGKGAPGFVKATGQLHLEARSSQTFMTYSGQAQIGGRIASVGQRLVESSARSIIRQSLDALNDYLKAQVAAQLVAEPISESVATSEHGATPVAKQHEHATSSAHAAHAAPVVSTYKPPTQMQLAFNVVRDVIGDFIPRQYQAPILTAAIIIIAVLFIWYFASQ